MSERLTATCPACRDVALLAERIMVCEGCEAIYHDSCWRKNGGRCLDPECSQYAPAPAASRPVVPEPPPRPSPRKGLPTRIQSGSISAEGLYIGGLGGRHIPWGDVEMLGLGIIELDLTIEMPRGALRSMLRKLMGDDSQPNQQRRQIRETFLLDIFIRDQDAPLRMDSSSVNYRSLLGEASYQSMRNFLRLLQKIASHTPETRLDASAAALLAGRRYEVKRYSSIHEFEMELHICRNRLSEQVLCSSVEIPQDAAGSEGEAAEAPPREPSHGHHSHGQHPKHEGASDSATTATPEEAQAPAPANVPAESKAEDTPVEATKTAEPEGKTPDTKEAKDDTPQAKEKPAGDAPTEAGT